MTEGKAFVRLGLLVIAASLAACGGAAPPSSTAATPSVQAAGSGLPSPAEGLTIGPSPDFSATAAPSPSSRSSASQTAERVARWTTTPHPIFNGGCLGVGATVDDSGRFHVAAGCWPRIEYASSTDGRSWKASMLATPAGRFDIDPLLTVDGTTLYLAFTRMRPIDPDTCGDDRPQGVVGVYYRTRELPGGKWSAATRIGHVGDYLQSFRVVDGVIHETVMTDDGGVSYASQDGSRFRATPIPGAEATSLRIGDDGRPRIAYTTGHSVRYSVVSTTGRLSTATVFSADDVVMRSPVLVLGSGDHAFVSWSAIMGSDEPGCSEAPTPSNEGTWFATDVDGGWESTRLSKDIGSASLVLDVDAGRLHATYNDRSGVRYVTRSRDGTWSGTRLDVSTELEGRVLRRDPVSGTLLLVGTSSGDETKPGIYALTAS